MEDDVHFIELFLLALALSMDAFAISVCIGLSTAKVTPQSMLTAGLYFGGFQAGMPVAGYLVGTLFAEGIMAYGQWIAFALLCFLGGKMIVGSLRQECTSKPAEPERAMHMLPLALATSIDALAVGVSFAFLQVRVVPAASLIGIVTFLIAMAGVKIGSAFGEKLKSRAELAGGVILVLIGAKILLEHLGMMG